LIDQVGQGLGLVAGFLGETKNLFLELVLTNIFLNFFHHCFNLAINSIYTKSDTMANPLAGEKNAHL